MRMIYSTPEFGALYEWDTYFIQNTLYLEVLEVRGVYFEGFVDKINE